MTDAQAAQEALNSVAYKQYLASSKAAADLQKQTQKTAAGRYDQSFMENVKNLGWIPTANTPDQAGNAGSWDYGQLRDQGIATKAGTGFWNQLQDFAGRGALRSTEFTKSKNMLGNNLAQQKSDLAKGRTQFGEQQQADALAFQAQQEKDRVAALDQAKQAALTRLYNQNAGSVGL
jgi:hypothetical protein